MITGKPPLLVIVGPTAAGKTAFSIELALALKTEVITADSMQVYRGMDIGTAKPTPAERRGVVHHGIDLVDPDQRFNVADFRRYARAVIADMHGRGLLPILAGGTGFYIQAVLEDFPFPDGPSDWALRRRLEAEAEKEGPDRLHARLAAVDPLTAARLHPHDVRRVVRALEVYERTGETLAAHIARRQAADPLYDALIFGLRRPREQLYERINARVLEQVDAGLVREVQTLLARFARSDDGGTDPKGEKPGAVRDEGQSPSDALHVALKGLGYKEIIRYLEGHCTLEDAITVLQRDTRRFARRQLTWFRADKRIRWIDLDDYPTMAAATAPVLEAVGQRWPQFR